MEEAKDLQEVKPLREPVRSPEHCGKPMRKLQGVSGSTGKVLTVYECVHCSTQVRTEAPK